MIDLKAPPQKFLNKVIFGLARFSNRMNKIVDLLNFLHKFGDGTRSGIYHSNP